MRVELRERGVVATGRRRHRGRLNGRGVPWYGGNRRVAGRRRRIQAEGHLVTGRHVAGRHHTHRRRGTAIKQYPS